MLLHAFARFGRGTFGAALVVAFVGCGGNDDVFDPGEPATNPDGGQDAAAAADGSDAALDARSEAEDLLDANSEAPDDCSVEGGTDGTAPEGSDEASSDATAEQDAQADAVEEICTASTWYHDKDGDTYGDSSDHVDACVAPDGYVTVAGDCRDDNADVHPGQITYFGAGFTDPNKPGGISFDYDCNGIEDAAPNQSKAPACAGLLVCQGSGYELYAPARSGPGIDGYCGSSLVSTCTVSGLACQAATVSSTQAYICK